MAVYTDFFIASDNEINNCQKFSEGLPKHLKVVMSKGMTPDVLAYLESKLSGRTVNCLIKDAYGEAICEIEDWAWIYEVSDFLCRYLATANLALLQPLVDAMISYGSWTDRTLDAQREREYRSDLHDLFRQLAYLAGIAKANQKKLYVWVAV